LYRGRERPAKTRPTQRYKERERERKRERERERERERKGERKRVFDCAKVGQRKDIVGVGGESKTSQNTANTGLEGILVTNHVARQYGDVQIFNHPQ